MHINTSKHILHDPASGDVFSSCAALMFKGKTHLKANSMVDDATMKLSQGGKDRTKFVLFPQSSTLKEGFPLFLCSHHSPWGYSTSTRKEASPHSYWSWRDNHERINLHKAIIAPVLCPPLKQWMWVWAHGSCPVAGSGECWCAWLLVRLPVHGWISTSSLLLQSQKNSTEIS